MDFENSKPETELVEKARYLAPERFLATNEELATKASDLWSFGCILY
jgi:serine/threonine protein kinase